MDGEWASKTDGEFRGCIEGGVLVWEEDGTETTLTVHGERMETVSMLVDGESHYGVMSEDGRILKWHDGDTWVRITPEGAIDRHLRDYGAAALEVDDSLEWVGWSFRRPTGVPRHTCKSAASAAYAAYWDY